MELRTLPKSFKKCGVIYNLVRRESDVALYALYYDHQGPIIGYDVVRVVVQDGREFNGLKYAPREAYPSGERFGSLGWSFSTLECAEDCFKSKLKSV